MNFTELNVKEEIVNALNELGIKEPTTIQQKAIPLVKAGKDIIGMSKTGSGKTAAFGIPTLEQIEPKKGIQLFIMAPTRELAVQIAKDLRNIGKYLSFTIATIYGGVGYQPQEDALKKAEIVVGTPGRLLDLLQKRAMDLSPLKCVILDEADKMVEMGFIEDINEILGHMPDQKQVLLFGATLSDDIDNIRDRYMSDPVTAEAEAQVKEEFLKQYYYDLKPFEKFSLLVHLLKTEKINRALIFCSARTTVELVQKNLRLQGIKAEMIHGKLSQNRRLRVIEGFNKEKINILVASPVAARGLHIDDISHVFNYDLSQDAQEYIHRVGRAARAGNLGKAITLLSEKDYDTFNEILARHQVPVEELPKGVFPKLHFEIVRDRRDNRFGRGFRGRESGFGGRGRGSGPRRFGPPRGEGGERRSYSSGRRDGRSGDPRGERRGYGRERRQPRSREMTRDSPHAPAWAR